MSGHLRLASRLSKLRAMSWPEIAHRLSYRAFLMRERRDFSRQTLALPDRLRAALLPALQAGDWERTLLAARAESGRLFFPSVGERRALQRLFASRYPSERDDMRAKAELARAGRFEFFGQQFQYEGEIPWQSDPVTGHPWPPVYHADMLVHRGDVGFGDVKHVWELSRQQYLIDLGKSVFLDDDRESLAALRDLVRSWMAGNPYATGVNWSVALEPAFRSFSWLWAYFLSKDQLDDAFHLEWLRGFYDHGRFIHAHLEHYTSPYNHLIGEAAALYLLGTCFPEFRESAQWRSTARTVFERRLDEQFYADGGSVEQSTFYHHATVGYLLLAALVARAAGDELPEPVWKAIERGLDFSLALMQPDGRTPEIGGADDGKPIRMEHLPFWDFRPYLAIGAVLFGRGDFKRMAGRFHEDALWLLGSAGLEAFEALPGGQPATVSSALTHSGYFVLRSDWTPDADYVCFDCGEQAAGMRPDAIPNSMHGHADCLSVVVWLRGQRVLVDSGLYAYNCGGEWESHFRETAAHNTARVDGRDQARHLGKMAWSHSYRAMHEGWNVAEHDGWVVGSHDGFARGPQGVTHRRAVYLRHGAYVAICDEFVGDGPHELEVNFQFAPGRLVPRETDGATFNEATAIRWTGTGAWASTCVEGGDSPADGWIAPSLGVRQPAPRVRLRSGMDAGRATLLTVLTAPGVTSAGDRESAQDVPDVVVTGDGWSDHIAARPTGQDVVVIRHLGPGGATRTTAVSRSER